MRYTIAVCLVLAVGPVVHAGAVIDLIPTEPGPYMPGQRVEVQVHLSQEPGGRNVFLRMAQFDFVDTDPALTLDQEFRFDYSAQNVCARHPGQCGTQHAEFPELTPFGGGIGLVTSTVFTGVARDPERQLRLPAQGTITVGSIGVTLPFHPGDYLLDVMNADQVSRNAGARLDFGFGSASGPDPHITWHAYDDWAIAGGTFMASTMAGAGFQFEYNPIPGVITPEPASLMLLALGGMAALGRRSATGGRRDGSLEYRIGLRQRQRPREFRSPAVGI